MTGRKPRGDIADRRVMEMIPGRLWAVHDCSFPYYWDGPRITFHYSEEAARHHYETGHPR